MSEELTVSVRQQVELHLKQTLLNFQSSVDFVVEAMPELREFYNATVVEFSRVVDEYAAGGKPTLGANPDTPEPQQIEVGDLVRLTGDEWKEISGGVYAIVSIDSDGDPVFYDRDGDRYYVTQDGYEAEIYKKASEL